MRARDVFFGPEKLRALWRVLIFLVLAFASFWLLLTVTSPLVPSEQGYFWGLAFPSALLVVAILLPSFVMMRWIERRPFAAMGLPLGKEAPRGFLRGAVIGGGFIALIVVLETVVGWLRPAPDAGTLLGWLEEIVGLALLVAVAAAAEELLFRGYAFQVLVEGAGVTLALILSAGTFTFVHLRNPEVTSLGLLNIGFAGVLMALAYLRTRSLWVALGLHWAWNYVMAAVFDLPVSGIHFDVSGYDTLLSGPELVTGGAFGPEGGLLTTVLSLPLIVWVFRTRWLAESPRMAALKPLVDARDLP
ncbi:MAG: CPBP family intramembrane metalloprotease [Gemmatimonadota bacterium]|nr:MAG: CPBP family intramembrane metalloprotease [Gemmatimonadota bacterium]